MVLQQEIAGWREAKKETERERNGERQERDHDAWEDASIILWLRFTGMAFFFLPVRFIMWSCNRVMCIAQRDDSNPPIHARTHIDSTTLVYQTENG